MLSFELELQPGLMQAMIFPSTFSFWRCYWLMYSDAARAGQAIVFLFFPSTCFFYLNKV
jgi:hypothetical protein